MIRRHLIGVAAWLLACGVAPAAYAQTTTVNYTYDSCDGSSTLLIGRLCKVEDSSGTAAFSYDYSGRTISTVKTLVGQSSMQTVTGYDTADRVTSVSYPDGTAVNYEYLGTTLKRVYEGATNYAQYAGYSALGQPGTVTYGNGVRTSYTYSQLENSTCTDANFRLCQIISDRSGTQFQNIQFNYKNQANQMTTNVTGMIDGFNGSQTFGYDHLNRLTSASGPYGAFAYGYDEIGNLTSNSQLGTYSYPTGGPTTPRPHAVTEVRDASNAVVNSYSYDANGNRVAAAGGQAIFSYDVENRLTRYAVPVAEYDVTYVYDGDGGRVKRTYGNFSGGSVTTIYFGKLFECTVPCQPLSAGSKYIFAGAQRIAIKPVGTSGEIYYYHPDHLGSTNLVTNASGATVETIRYEPYGQQWDDVGSKQMTHKYTGQEYDIVSGLYFYNSRYYAPSLGRFSQPDSIIPSIGDPQSLNRYAYANNNPLKYTDPSGHIPILAVIAIASAIGAISAGAQSDWDPAAMFMGAGIGAISAGVGGGVFALANGGLSGAMLGGMAGSGAGALLAQGAGADVDVGLAIFAGGFGGLIGAGVGQINPFLGAAAGASAAAIITGGDPGRAAVMAVAVAAAFWGVESVAQQIAKQESSQVSTLKCMPSNCRAGREYGYLTVEKSGENDVLHILFRFGIPGAQANAEGEPYFSGFEIFGRKPDGSTEIIFDNAGSRISFGDFLDTLIQRNFINNMPKTGMGFINVDVVVPHGEYTHVEIKSYPFADDTLRPIGVEYFIP